MLTIVGILLSLSAVFVLGHLAVVLFGVVAGALVRFTSWMNGDKDQ